jgi:PhoPQ-activated pathogenicity-related protein
MVDPFVFREKITQPKLIILGNNDPYWATDALNLYWEGLPGPKWIHYVPNAGHNLVQETGGKKLPPMGAINTLGVFTRHQLTKQPLPELEWKHDDSASGRPRLTVKTTIAPKVATMWIAHAPTHDFRAATWTDRPLAVDGLTIAGEIDLPATGSTAFYATVGFEFEEVPYSFCTQLRIVDAAAGAK